MRIEVTQEDIDKGVQNDCHNCPVALALKRLDKRDVTVMGFIEFRDDDGWHSFTPPGIVSFFMDRFDQDGIVRPFSFDLL